MNAEHEADIVVNRLQNFFKHNRQHLIIAISFFVLAFIGYGSYEWYSHQRATQAGKDFFTLMRVENVEEQLALASKFEQKHAGSGYAGLVSLILIQNDLMLENWQGVDMRVQALAQKRLPAFIMDQAYYLQIKRYLATKQYNHATQSLQKINQPQATIALIYKGIIAKKMKQNEVADEAFALASKQIEQISPNSPINQLMWYQRAS